MNSLGPPFGPTAQTSWTNGSGRTSWGHVDRSLPTRSRQAAWMSRKCKDIPPHSLNNTTTHPRFGDSTWSPEHHHHHPYLSDSTNKHPHRKSEWPSTCDQPRIYVQTKLKKVKNKTAPQCSQCMKHAFHVASHPHLDTSKSCLRPGRPERNVELDAVQCEVHGRFSVHHGFFKESHSHDHN